VDASCLAAGESPNLLVKTQTKPGVFGHGQSAIESGCQEEPAGTQRKSCRARGATHRCRDAMHALLVERADELMGCAENSPEGAELASIAEALEAYEALRWPLGKIPERLAPSGRRQSGAASARPKVRCKIGRVSYIFPVGSIGFIKSARTPHPLARTRILGSTNGGTLGNERPLFIRPALGCTDRRSVGRAHRLARLRHHL